MKDTITEMSKRMVMKVKIFAMSIFLSFVYGQTFAQDIEFYYEEGKKIGKNAEGSTTQLGTAIKKQSIDSADSLLNQLIDLFKLSERDWYASGDSKVVYYVKWITNVALALVSLISLVLLIYGFYMMFFSKDEEGFSKAKKILKGVVIALAIMGLSWLIVSFFFNTQQILVP